MLEEVKVEKENMYLEKCAAESKLDGKDNSIAEVRHELSLARDEVSDLKQVIESLQQSMMNHEEESA